MITFLRRREFPCPATSRLWMVALAGMLLAGCTTDPEDRAFFYRGWVHPETDADAQRHVHEAAQQPHPGLKSDPLVDE